MLRTEGVRLGFPGPGIDASRSHDKVFSMGKAMAQKGVTFFRARKLFLNDASIGGQEKGQL